MTQIALQLSNTDNTVVLSLTFTLSATQNADGSYTVTSAAGTYTTVANNQSTTINVTGLEAGSIDGADNKIFIGNGVAAVDLGGVTVTTDGQPNGATYVGGNSSYPADINLFYTGSTNLLGTTLLTTGRFGVDTSPVTYLRLTSETLLADNGVTMSIDPACFLEGTTIRTPEGDRRVETLRRGDLVIDADGRSRRIDWIGRHTARAPFARPLRTLPIRIRAHALADNVPWRDLLVSPDHALRVEDILVNAGALVNGVSIVRETAMPPVFTYFHVELDDHALILAENAPAETFIDNVDRMGFDNWAEHEALYPDGKPMRELLLPRAKAARQAPKNIRDAITERAERLYGQARAA
jgi:hypothetical protein